MVNIDDIAAEIRLMIDNGSLPVGERLPAERKLCEMLGVSRGYIRKALSKLELCGAIVTKPQSGSYVAEHFFESLVGARILLEVECLRLAALNRTEEDLKNMEEAMVNFVKNDSETVHANLDMAFHHALASGSHNSVLTALLRTVTQEAVSYYHKYNVCVVADPKVIEEHSAMLDAIRRRDPDLVEDVFMDHLSAVINFAQASKSKAEANIQN